MVAFPSPGAMRPTARDNAKAALRISEGFNMESKHNRLIGYLVYDERKGLVVRNKHKTDRRSHVVSTTDKAHELIRTVLPLTAITANRLIEGIDQQDIDTFVEVLTALKQNAETISGN